MFGADLIAMSSQTGPALFSNEAGVRSLVRRRANCFRVRIKSVQLTRVRWNANNSRLIEITLCAVLLAPVMQIRIYC